MLASPREREDIGGRCRVEQDLRDELKGQARDKGRGPPCVVRYTVGFVLSFSLCGPTHSGGKSQPVGSVVGAGLKQSV